MSSETDKIIKTYSDAISSKKKDFFFIQIGSNDGQTNDPIHKFVKEFGWKGILVEPVSEIFEKLKKNYEDSSRLTFENCAIDRKDGHRTFYRIKKNEEADTPLLEKKYQTHLGSFLKEVVLKHKNAIPNFEKHFVEEEVKTLAFSTLLEKHKVEKIDLLHIDTEGYDYEIIKLIPFERLKPTMILYEHKNLKKNDSEDCRTLLRAHGYRLLEGDEDTLAYRAMERHLLLLDLIKDYKVGAEIGVMKGELSKQILSAWAGKLFMIDAWRHIPGLVDYTNPDHNGQLDNMAHTFMSVYDFGERACIIREMSVAAANLFADGSLDFVYIDAGHDKKSVLEDLQAWYLKVKKGGLLIGDDYFDARIYLEGVENSDTLIEVKSTVDEFAKNLGKQVHCARTALPTMTGTFIENALCQWWIYV